MSEVRRATAEIHWGDDPGAVIWVGKRTIHQYWPLLSPYFRDVFLPPQRRSEEDAVTWSWREAGDAAPPSASELATLRKRLADDAESFADNLARRGASAGDAGNLRGPTNSDELGVVTETMIARLGAMADAELAAFVCRTESGLRLHSWGAPVAACATFPDEQKTAAREADGACGIDATRQAGAPPKRARWRAGLIAFLILALVGAGGAWLRWRAAPAQPSIAIAPTASKAPATKREIETSARPLDALAPKADAVADVRVAGASAGGSAAFGQVRSAATSLRAEQPAPSVQLGSGFPREIALPSDASRPGAQAGSPQASPGKPTGANGAGVAAGVAGGSPAQATANPTAPDRVDAPDAAASTAHTAKPSDAKHSQAAPVPAKSAAPPPSVASESAESRPPAPRRATDESATNSLATAPASVPEASESTRTDSPRSETDAPRRNADRFVPLPADTRAPRRSLAAAEPVPGVADAGRSAIVDGEERENLAVASHAPEQANIARSFPAVVATETDTPAWRREVRVRLSGWRPRLLGDVILPTKPSPVGEAESIAAMREDSWREKRAQFPASFREPVMVCGYTLEIAADLRRGGLWWHPVSGARPARASAGAGVAEIGWSGSGEAAAWASVLRTAAGIPLAEVRCGEAGVSTLRVAEGVVAHYWISMERVMEDGVDAKPADSPRFEWQSGSGLPLGAHDRFQIAATAAPGGAMRQAIALRDRATGWALVGEIGFESEMLPGGK